MKELIAIVGVPMQVRAKFETYFHQCGRFRSDVTVHIIDGPKSDPDYNITYTNKILSNIYCKIKDCPPEKLKILYFTSTNAQKLREQIFLFANDILIPHHIYSHKLTDLKRIAQETARIAHLGMRLPKPAKNHYRALPSINFRLSGMSLYELFKRMYLEENVGDQHIAIDTTSKNGKEICVDSRRCMFFPCKSPEGNSSGELDCSHILRSMYRFGWFLGAGFHFDVSHLQDSSLHGMEFQCSVVGNVTGCKRTAYLNIYLNDFIRGKYNAPKNKRLPR